VDADAFFQRLRKQTEGICIPQIRLANITVPSLAVAAILFASRLVYVDSSRNIMSISDLI